MTTDSEIRGQYLNWGPIFYFCPSFLCLVTLKLAVSRSLPTVPYGANFFLLVETRSIDPRIMAVLTIDVESSFLWDSDSDSDSRVLKNWDSTLTPALKISRL